MLAPSGFCAFHGWPVRVQCIDDAQYYLYVRAMLWNPSYKLIYLQYVYCMQCELSHRAAAR